jgi:hypothetical protein
MKQNFGMAFEPIVIDELIRRELIPHSRFMKQLVLNYVLEKRQCMNLDVSNNIRLFDFNEFYQIYDRSFYSWYMIGDKYYAN